MDPRRLHRAAFVAAVLAGVLPPCVEAQNEAVAVYYRGVADHFGLPPTEVRVLEGWRLQPEEVPVALFLSRRAGVSPDAVVALKSAGQTWGDLARRYGLGPAVFHVPVRGPVPAGPLARAYEAFRTTPSADWSQIHLEDTEVVHLVNLRVLSEYLNAEPARVLEARQREGSFVGAYRALLRAG